MSTHPFIPLYVDDYDAATAHLTPAQDGIYGRLLRLCWRTPGCSLPNDEAWIARKVRLSGADWARIGKPVLEEFFKLQRGRFVQKRLKAEYDDISRKKSARKAAGKKGGDAKAAKTKEKSPSNATVLPPDTRAFPEPEPEDKPPVAPQGGEAQLALLSAEPDPPDPIRQAFDAWNALAERLGLPRADLLTDARRRKLKGRLAEGGLERWARALAAVEASAFCRGQRSPKPGQTKPFRADLDFVCQATSYDRLTSGFYGEDAAPPSGPAAPPDPLAAWRARCREHAANGYWNSLDWGPKPGRPDCRAPPEVLAEFGLQPTPPAVGVVPFPGRSAA